VLDPTILYYRKDLLQQEGLKPPTTLQELGTVAAKLHDPPRVYGFVSRGLKNTNVAPFSFVMYAFGGQYLTPDRKSALNTPAWIKAVDWYAGNVRRFGPPGVVNYNWYECSAAFMQGQVATYLDGIAFAPQFEDKEKSGSSPK
jgi:multiple sugar transport system substrate-binding protein